MRYLADTTVMTGPFSPEDSVVEGGFSDSIVSDMKVSWKEMKLRSGVKEGLNSEDCKSAVTHCR